mmetsp:Transcript_8575/g.12641  ORF Transcript_8575/g.12641 Transcript_8575/m.12641 type:complete len:613 (+) Transcript_8575:37-1875(+)
MSAGILKASHKRIISTALAENKSKLAICSHFGIHILKLSPTIELEKTIATKQVPSCANIDVPPIIIQNTKNDKKELDSPKTNHDDSNLKEDDVYYICNNKLYKNGKDTGVVFRELVEELLFTKDLIIAKNWSNHLCIIDKVKLTLVEPPLNLKEGAPLSTSYYNNRIVCIPVGTVVGSLSVRTYKVDESKKEELSYKDVVIGVSSSQEKNDEEEGEIEDDDEEEEDATPTQIVDKVMSEFQNETNDTYIYSDRIETQNRIVKLHDHEIMCARMNSRGSIIASISDRGTLIRITSLDDDPVKKLKEFRRGIIYVIVHDLAFSHDDSMLFAYTSRNSLHVFSVQKAKNIYSKLYYLSYVGLSWYGYEWAYKEIKIEHPLVGPCRIAPLSSSQLMIFNTLGKLVSVIMIPDKLKKKKVAHEVVYKGSNTRRRSASMASNHRRTSSKYGDVNVTFDLVDIRDIWAPELDQMKNLSCYKMKKFPTKLPYIIIPRKSSRLLALPQSKFMIPMFLSMQDVRKIIFDQLLKNNSFNYMCLDVDSLDPSVIELFINSRIISQSDSSFLSQRFDQDSSPDGFVHVRYDFTNSFIKEHLPEPSDLQVSISNSFSESSSKFEVN